MRQSPTFACCALADSDEERTAHGDRAATRQALKCGHDLSHHHVAAISEPSGSHPESPWSRLRSWSKSGEVKCTDCCKLLMAIHPAVSSRCYKASWPRTAARSERATQDGPSKAFVRRPGWKRKQWIREASAITRTQPGFISDPIMNAKREQALQRIARFKTHQASAAAAPALANAYASSGR
jgi:hypothetical protein